MSASNLIVEFKLLHPDAVRPEYKTDGASGMDLCAENDSAPGCWPETDHGYKLGLKLMPMQTSVIGTGIAVSIPQGWEAQIRPRSSLSAKGILCQLGTIDSDYRGELKVVLVNLSGEPFEVKRGDRIAQLVFAPVARAALQRVPEFTTQTKRGEGGFGSTNENMCHVRGHGLPHVYLLGTQRCVHCQSS